MNLNDAVLNEENWKDNAKLLGKFLDTEIFFQLVNPLVTLPDGVTVTSRSNQLSMQYVPVADERFALFYTTKISPSGTNKIAGVPLRAAVKMVLGNARVNGLLLQSTGAAWVVATKNALQEIEGVV